MTVFANHKPDAMQAAIETAAIFPKNGPDPSARSWGHDPEGQTFRAQHGVPKLPLPSLEGSCERYLQAVKALQSTDEHGTSTAAVHSFLQHEGPLLQKQLEAYNKSHVNWFENFCEYADGNRDSKEAHREDD